MNNKRRFFFSVIMLVFGASLGCSSSIKSKEYATASLAERSPTLPNDVSAWKPIFGFAPSKESSSIISPLQWESGYSESLTLIWMPLPLQIRYLFWKDQEQWLFTEVALFGSNYSRSRDYNWRPSALLGWKRKLAQDFAFESKLLYQAEVKRGSDEPFSRTISLESGVYFQLTPWLGLHPAFSIWNESGAVRTQYLGEVPPSLQGDEAKNTHWRFPIHLGMVARFADNMELQTEVRYYRIGFDADYTEVPIFFTLAYYW